MMTNTVKAVSQVEPVTFFGLLATLFNALALVTLPVAPWIHIVILVASYAFTLLATRKRTVPLVNADAYRDPVAK